LLPPVFGHLSKETMQGADVGVSSELHHGGTAISAYARLQFQETDPLEREAIEQALLRYCELDTLAMVMVVQAWYSCAAFKTKIDTC